VVFAFKHFLDDLHSVVDFPSGGAVLLSVEWKMSKDLVDKDGGVHLDLGLEELKPLVDLSLLLETGSVETAGLVGSGKDSADGIRLGDDEVVSKIDIWDGHSLWDLVTGDEVLGDGDTSDASGDSDFHGIGHSSVLVKCK